MKKLFIVGAGGFGREVLAWALNVPIDMRDWEVAGFLDSNPAALKDYSYPFKIIGDPLSFVPSTEDRFICAIGDPRTKLRLCRDIKARNGKFITLIHPTTVIGAHCHLGEGCILCPGTVLTTDVVLGNYVTLNLHAVAGHDANIGDGCTLGPHSSATGFVMLGEGVFLGSHATVLPSARVGDYAVVGAGSVVLRKVPAHSTVMGVPAKPIYYANTSSEV